MRVHNPGPGEIADRMGILSRKIKAILKNRDGDAEAGLVFSNERESLRALLAEKFPQCVNSRAWSAMYDLLWQTNGQIWELTDVLHDYDLPDEEYARKARLAFMLNEQRANIIGEINALFGVARQEKV